MCLGRAESGTLTLLRASILIVNRARDPERHRRIGPFLIVGDKLDQPRTDLKKPWSAVCRHAGLEGVRLHDLRHTFASIGAGASLGLPIVGKLLGHSQPQTTARYAHLDADPLLRAANLIGERIESAMNPVPTVSADR